MPNLDRSKEGDSVLCQLVYVPQNKSPALFTYAWREGLTIEALIQASNFVQIYPEVTTLRVGIFARHATLETKVKPGDRVELYRPLQIDPKEKRRRKAKNPSL